MSDSFTKLDILNAIAKGSSTLSSRKDEINRLNVFPVPDGDTGSNMSLTLESVVANLRELPANPSTTEIRKAITSGALMGARGNSGVITSQILRGICEGYPQGAQFNTDSLASAFSKATEIAFQAVRKPVEGTILTVLRDTAQAASDAAEKGLNTQEAMECIVNAAYASVERTPELLPVLKENNVVDAGGFGFAILIDGIFSALSGKETVGQLLHIGQSAPKVEIEHINDWEGSKYRYCNEFLVDSDTLDTGEALDFLATMGDCELCVGAAPKFKVHVHSNHPDQVLKYFLDRGQIFEVFIHNMDLQSQDRANKIALEEGAVASSTETNENAKPLGFVAVAPGDGNAAILKSLGVDVVVSGGQTMNPSTKDLYDAVEKTPAESVIILPNNSNIIMAANSACELTKKPCSVVPTKSVPQSFAAMFAVNLEASLEENVEAMEDAAAQVKTGEVTTAIKNSKDAHKNKIRKGDIIGIADGSIEAVGKTVEAVVIDLLLAMEAKDFDTLTLLAGKDYDDESLSNLSTQIEEAFPELEIDAQRGGQPLYPIVFSVE